MESQPRRTMLSKKTVARLSSHGKPAHDMLSIENLAFQFGESTKSLLPTEILIPHFKVMENLPISVLLSNMHVAKFSSQIEESIRVVLSSEEHLAPHTHVNHKAYNQCAINVVSGFPKPTLYVLSKRYLAWN